MLEQVRDRDEAESGGRSGRRRSDARQASKRLLDGPRTRQRAKLDPQQRVPLLKISCAERARRGYSLDS
jgi:hypothetical protein